MGNPLSSLLLLAGLFVNGDSNKYSDYDVFSSPRIHWIMPF